MFAYMQRTHAITPRWLSYKGASQYSGLSIRLLQDHVKAGLIVASNVIAPGSSRGRRVICRRSLDAFIEAGIGRVAQLKVNQAHRGLQGGDQ
jgi:hypothetical protein